MAGNRICTTWAQGFTILFSTSFCTDLYIFPQKSLIFKPLPQEEIQFPLPPWALALIKLCISPSNKINLRNTKQKAELTVY